MGYEVDCKAASHAGKPGSMPVNTLPKLYLEEENIEGKVMLACIIECDLSNYTHLLNIMLFLTFSS